MLTFFLSGNYLSRILTMRVKTLKKLSIMLSNIKNQFEFSCPDLSEMIINLSKKGSLEDLFFLKDCAKRLQDNEAFPTAWRASLLNNRSKLCLKSDDFNSLLSFGEDLGTTAVEGQISICEMYKSLIDESLDNAQKSSQKYSRLFAPLALLLGAAATVMLI